MKSIDPIQHAKEVHDQFRDTFVQFSRNGKWGTCGGCPQDAYGNKYPESCMYFRRHDHQLDFEELVDTYRNYLRIDNRKQQE